MLRNIAGSVELKRLDIAGSVIAYWSSTEDGSANAWNFSFTNGGANDGTNLYNTLYVRAVRAF